jgi:molybdopterin converting factor small subunit
MRSGIMLFSLWKRGMKGDLASFQKAKLLQPMKIFINLFGTDIRLREAISLEPASPSLKDVLRVLKDQYKGPLERYVQDDFSPVEGSAILVNGRNIGSLDGLKTKIQDGDELTFTVLVAGG